MIDRRTTETQGNHDLFEAFADPGCPVCALSRQAVSRYMGATNYDSLGDPDIRRRFEASMGFCNRHAHQWLEEAFILGTAQMYRDILLQAREEVRQRRWRGGGALRKVGSLLSRQQAEPGEGDRFLRPTAPCPACEILAETEARLTRTLVQGVAEPDFRAAFTASDGLCIPHLRTALAAAPREDAFNALRDRALATEDILLAHLEETIRKHDYRFRHEPAGDEKGSPARAVSHVAGHSGSLGPAERAGR